MNSYILSELEKKYRLVPRDMGDLAEIRSGLTRFSCRTCRIEGIGNLFFIDMKAAFGLMKMETAVLTPTARDLSFCNFDAVHAMGNDTLIFEMYRTCIRETDLSALDAVKRSADDLPGYTPAPRWYDAYKLSPCTAKKGRRAAQAHDALMRRFLDAYLALLDAAPECDEDEKLAAVRPYVDRLLAEGGMAVDGMKRMIGEEKTARLVREFMYGVGGAQ